MLFLNLFCILVRETLDSKGYGYKCYSKYNWLERKVGMYMYLRWIFITVQSFFLSFWIIDTIVQVFPFEENMLKFYSPCFRAESHQWHISHLRYQHNFAPIDKPHHSHVINRTWNRILCFHFQCKKKLIYSKLLLQIPMTVAYQTRVAHMAPVKTCQNHITVYVM